MKNQKRPSKPGRGSEQFVIRFPEGMRERLALLASANGRSMNAELVRRLEESMTASDEVGKVAAKPPAKGTVMIELNTDKIMDAVKANFVTCWANACGGNFSASEHLARAFSVPIGQCACAVKARNDEASNFIEKFSKCVNDEASS